MELVLKFYNDRRKQLLEVKPNKAHLAIANLEKDYKVTIITQDVDDLHDLRLADYYLRLRHTASGLTST